MKTDRMKTWHMTNPVGFEMEAPLLSFEVVEGGDTVQAVRVLVSAWPNDWEAPLYDSGWQENPDTRAFEVPMSLAPCTRYWWRVLLRNAVGRVYASDTAFFETAKEATPWEARWIASPEEMEGTPCFHREIVCVEPAAWGRIYICGLGLYELYIDGGRVGDEYLTPYCNNYDCGLQYQTFDVTAYLSQGKHDLVVLMGDGWYMGRFSSRMRSALFGDRHALLAEIRMRSTSGEEVVFGTDMDWRVSASPVLSNSIYDGEVWDERRYKDCFENPKDWKGAVWRDPFGHGPLRARLSPPLRVQRRINAYKQLRTPAGETVLDFGQNMAGWVEFDSLLQEGERVCLQYGEVLQDGCFYRDNLRTAKAEYTYIAAERWAHVRPHFTYYGFRYVRVVGRLEALANIHACVVHSDMDRTGWMETSNPKLNRLLENARWGQMSNFVDVPTDCPQRDERLGWTGDAQVFAQTASFQYDVAAFYRKYMADMSLEQRRFEGAVPYVVPDMLRRDARGLGRDEENGVGSCAWGDAATVIPWTLYMQYGNKAMLREQYPSMKAWVEYIRRNDDRYGCGRLWTTGFHFADWLALDHPDAKSRHGGTDPYFVASCYYFYSASLTAKAACALGCQDDAIRYARLSEEVRASILRAWLPEGILKIRTQTAAALVLYMQIVPEAWRVKVAAQLRALLREQGDHLTTGFVGTACLCTALSDCGYTDVAYTLLLREDYPSWLYAVNLGATTIWERWNSLLPDGRVSDTGMNSLNHYAYGAVVGWMFRTLGGLSPLSPGYARAMIRPRPDRRLGFAWTVYHSASGRFEIAWRYAQDCIEYEIAVPDRAEAVFILEGIQHRQLLTPAVAMEEAAEGLYAALKAGRHHFTVLETDT